ncbi:MAG: sulfatase-like hydrolase/transferase [Bryobacterales bacterium]|nr:sulfatase-like hydrolase/transferase [Bryobacterales bacterium]
MGHQRILRRCRDTIRGKGGRDRKKAANEGALALWWTPTNNDDSEEPDGRTARRIAQLMAEKRDKPFFLGCGFHKPHLPWVAPKKYFDLYPPDRIELPNTPANDRDDIPPIALTHQPADDNLTDADRRQAIAAYHAATSFMDAQVGYVLRQLDTLKLWDNTVVLLFGDHGWHLNEHLGLWRKMSLFEESSRAPLIVAAPGIKPAATRALTEFVDIYPTLAELAGLKPPAHALEGTSFAPVLREPARRWKKAAFTVVSRGRRTLGHTIRTERYRYTEWDSPGVNELYDHQADPKEFTNLARDPKNAPLVAQMRKALNDGWRAALP